MCLGLLCAWLDVNEHRLLCVSVARCSCHVLKKNIPLPHAQHQGASYHFRSVLWCISLAVFSSDLFLVSLCAADLI